MNERKKEHTEIPDYPVGNYLVLPSILAFLDRIGIVWRMEALYHPTFLPGIEVVRGELVIDPVRLAHPGDLLHEAGHIAVAAGKDRARLNGDIEGTLGKNISPELGAVAWSYAAALEIGLDPQVVFHGEGYKGDSGLLAQQFEEGNTMGQPLLAWMGMCAWRGKPEGLPEFPKMVKWLRD